MTQGAAECSKGSEPAASDVTAAAGHRNLARATAKSPWLQSVSAQGAVIASGPGSTGSKYRRFVLLAERVSTAVTPFAACKNGCSHCCHIDVAMSEFEARQISKATGRELLVPPGDGSDDGAIEKYRGVPCPFLVGGACSIYEHRPIACRVHFNLADDESMCRLDVPSDESAVQYINLAGFWLANALAFGMHRQRDIRDFFGGTT
jgi:Fe-S-cluster containining protein